MIEALKQLREVHAIQGSDGCWDIDDYMLGLYNGLELALSIVESRECRYKNRPKPEQDEPVAWRVSYPNDPEHMKHEKTFEAINKLKDIEIELHRLKNALEMANRALDAQRTWVGLTLADKQAMLDDNYGGSRADIMDKVEAILKERNHD